MKLDPPFKVPLVVFSDEDAAVVLRENQFVEILSARVCLSCNFVAPTVLNALSE